MWYRDSKKSLYVPKTEFDIQRRGSDENITAFHHLEVARVRYPQDEIIEVRVSNNHVEYMRTVGDFGMDAGAGPSSYSERCVLKGGNDAESVDKHASWWNLTQTNQNVDKNTMTQSDAVRISSALESISRLLYTASDELLRSNRIGVISWDAYVEAAKNLEPSPKIPQSHYDDLRNSGSETVKNCLRTASNILIELQAHRHSDESLSKATWELEKAIECLAEADCESNDATLRGKMAAYASEGIDNVSWAIKMARHHLR